MAALETLEILIEADRSGLESQLKQASTSIQTFVSSMNRQEVNWTQILSKSVTPALIATIASTFAIAITQALQFQNAMQQSSLSAADSFGNNAANMSDAVLQTSSDTGKSATDVATAMGAVEQVFKSAADAQTVLNAVAEEASIRNMEVADAAKTLVPLFNQWGESASNVSNDLAVINASVKEGRINFDDLTTALTEQASAFVKVGMSIPQVASQLELISRDSSLTNDVVVSTFDAISKAIMNPNDQLNVLLGGINRVADDINRGGLPAVFKDISDHIRSAGNNAVSLYSATGLSAKAITQFGEQGKSAFDQIIPESDKLISNVSNLKTQMDQNMTATKELSKAWTNFMNDILAGPGKAFTGFLTDLTNGADTLLQMLEGNKDVMSQVLSGIGSTLGSGLTNAFGSLVGFAGMGLSPGSFGGKQSTDVSTNNTFISAPININSQPGSEGRTGEAVGSYLKNQVHL